MGEAMRGHRPLIVTDGSGQILDVGVMNRKGFTKSTEQGELWVVNEQTGKVLPYGGEMALSRLIDEGRWYRATVEPRPPQTGERANGRRVAGGGKPSVEAAKKDPAQRMTGRTQDASDAVQILRDLSEVIRRRREERPAGSYTTYLFDAGEEKIRKKTGEEAIELILARSHGEMVSEAADLIYHLLVLLNQLDIPLESVLQELKQRE